MRSCSAFAWNANCKFGRVAGKFTHKTTGAIADMGQSRGKSSASTRADQLARSWSVSGLSRVKTPILSIHKLPFLPTLSNSLTCRPDERNETRAYSGDDSLRSPKLQSERRTGANNMRDPEIIPPRPSLVCNSHIRCSLSHGQRSGARLI